MSRRTIPTVGVVTLKRSNRKTLAISVHPDGSIHLAAPRGARLDEIDKKAIRRSGWIRRQQRLFAALRSVEPSKRYCSGATHRYLGKQYRLKVRVGARRCVVLRGAYFHVFVPVASAQAVASALSAWYRARAQELFTRRLETWNDWCLAQGLPVPKAVILKMPKRWGSAHRDGRIYLNPDLVRAPSACVDYVLCHEVCHLKHPSHNRKFFGELAKLKPEWRKLKDRLESSG